MAFNAIALASAIKSVFFAPVRGWLEEQDNDVFSITSPNIMEKPIVTTAYGIKANPGFYQLDGVVSENYTSTLTLTKNPLETGVNISDHSYREPYVVAVDGIITNSPTAIQLSNKIPGNYAITDGFGAAALAAVSGAANVFTGQRIRNAWTGLNDLMAKKEIITLYTGLATYKNMVLTQLTTVNDQKNQLRVSMTFTEAIYIDEADGISVNNRLASAVVGVNLSRVVSTAAQYLNSPVSL